jgi:hypothetical protein
MYVVATSTYLDTAVIYGCKIFITQTTNESNRLHQARPLFFFFKGDKIVDQKSCYITLFFPHKESSIFLKFPIFPLECHGAFNRGNFGLASLLGLVLLPV